MGLAVQARQAFFVATLWLLPVCQDRGWNVSMPSGVLHA